MRYLRKWLALLSLALAAALVLAACDTNGPGYNNGAGANPGASTGATQPGVNNGAAQPATQTGTGSAPVASVPSSGAAGNVGVAGAQNIMMPASNLMGMHVENGAGSDLGKIDDLFIDLSNGNVLFATVQNGGLLGIGADYVPVPLSALSLDANHQLQLPIAANQFENFPSLSSDWPGNYQPGWNTDVANWWNTAGYDTSVLSTASNQVVRASELIGYGIDAPQAPGFGNVQDLIVDLQNSDIRYVAMSIADVGGYGNEWRLVPYSAFAPAAFGAGTLALNSNFDLNVLHNAPTVHSFDTANFDAFNNSWFNQFDQYWDKAGYTVAHGAATAATVVGNAADAAANAANEAAQQAKCCTNAANQANPQAAQPQVQPGQTAGTAKLAMLASNMMDQDIRGINGDDIGEVNDIFIDENTGNVLFVTIKNGGFLGIGAKEIPVPLNAVKYVPGAE